MEPTTHTTTPRTRNLSLRLTRFVSIVLFVGSAAGRARGGSADDPFAILPPADAKLALPLGGVIGNDGRVPSDVVGADFNGDGLEDLAISYAFDDAVRWFFATGGGEFRLGGIREVGTTPGPVNDLPRAMAAGDFDGDGFIDLAVVCSGDPERGTPPSLGILYGAPVGGFEAFRPIPLGDVGISLEPIFSSALAAGRIDRDDRLDLVVGHSDSNQLSVIRHRQGRHWFPARIHSVETGGFGPVEIEIVDIDSDGAGDLIVAGRGDLQIWHGDGEGGFPERVRIESGLGFTAIETADLDRDGRWDLIALDGIADTLQVFYGLNFLGGSDRAIEIPLPAGSGPIDLVRYDANLDGRDDVAVAFFFAGGGLILLGAPEFDPAPFVPLRPFATSARPRSIAAVDIDADRRTDLAIVSDGDEVDAANDDLVFDFNRLEATEGSSLGARNGSIPGVQIGPYLARPRGLAWDRGRGALWTIDRKERRIVRLTPEGDFLGAIPFAALAAPTPGDPTDGFPTLPIDPTDLAVGAAGGLWVTDRLAGRVLHLAGDGTVIGRFSTRPAGRNHPSGIAYDPLGDRLFVSDEIEGGVVIFSPAGEVLGRFPTPPLRDLAWDPVHSALWAILDAEPGALLILGFDTSAGVDAPAGEEFIPLSRIAPVLVDRAARSIAVGMETGGFWVLMDSGLLVRASSALRPEAMRELTLLRDIRAVAREPGGGVLLGDSGLLATLVRLGADGAVAGVMPLNSPGDAEPIEIAGLSRGPERIFVLDRRGGKIEIAAPDGSREATIPLGAPGFALGGLHVAPDGGSFFVGMPGRFVQFRWPTSTVPEIALPEPIAEHPLSATAPPSSISAGLRPGEIAVFSRDRGSLTFFGAGSLSTPSVEPLGSLTRVNGFPLRFKANAAAPAEARNRTWTLVGSGEPTLLTTQIELPPSRAGMAWTFYE